eukprot:TRINITY_DN28196_c0_g1_i1.p1 TRINITY_DN28196_c0_g1~~TRINITY_DN28196_c0_g1_i1.p1  ORF type:complete len:427 (+),score=91.04 TRINITY_DN28196_c0_g1_i1:295-1575(+)
MINDRAQVSMTATEPLMNSQAPDTEDEDDLASIRNGDMTQPDGGYETDDSTAASESDLQQASICCISGSIYIAAWNFLQTVPHLGMYRMGCTPGSSMLASIPDEQVALYQSLLTALSFLQLLVCERRFQCIAAYSICQDLAAAHGELTNSAWARALASTQGMLETVECLDYLGPQLEDMYVEFYKYLSDAKSQIESFRRNRLVVCSAALGVCVDTADAFGFPHVCEELQSLADEDSLPDGHTGSFERCLDTVRKAKAELGAHDSAVYRSLSAAESSLQSLVHESRIQHEAEHLWRNFAAAAAATEAVADADCLAEACSKLSAAKIRPWQALPETSGGDSNFYETLAIAMSSLKQFRRETHKDCLAALSACEDTADAHGFFNVCEDLKNAAEGGSWNCGQGGSLSLAVKAVQKAIGEAVGGTALHQY